MANQPFPLRDLQSVLLRQGVLRAAVYWASPARVFTTNFVGGTVAGVVVIVAAAIVLAVGAQRVGHQSSLYLFAKTLLAVVEALRARALEWPQ